MAAQFLQSLQRPHPPTLTHPLPRPHRYPGPTPPAHKKRQIILIQLGHRVNEFRSDEQNQVALQIKGEQTCGTGCYGLATEN
jgi:hypothetical protein